MTNIYNFHPKTGELISESPADESPLEPGVLLIPACATDIKPPEVGTHAAAVFEGGVWQLKSDWRGVALFGTSDGTPVSISVLGQTPDDVGATEQPIPSPAHSWGNGAWVLDESKVTALFAATKVEAITRVRDMRRPVFYTLAGMQSEALANGDTATAKTITSIQHAMRGLPDIDLSACKTEAEVNAAFASAWLAIVALAPASVASAFNEVVA